MRSVLVEVLMFSRCSSIPEVLCSYKPTHWGPGGRSRYIYARYRASITGTAIGMACFA